MHTKTAFKKQEKKKKCHQYASFDNVQIWSAATQWWFE